MKSEFNCTKLDKVILLIDGLCILIWTCVLVLTLLKSFSISLEMVETIIATIAVAISVSSIIYTEYSRKKQNAYEYKKNRIEKKIEKLDAVLYEEINNLKKACEFNIPIKFFTPEENVDFLFNKVFLNKSILVTTQTKVYWQYSDEQAKSAKELKVFIDMYNKILLDIDEQLNSIVEILSSTIKKLNDSKISKNMPEGWTDIAVIKEMQDELLKSLNILINYSQITINELYSKAKLVIKEYEEILLKEL